MRILFKNYNLFPFFFIIRRFTFNFKLNSTHSHAFESQSHRQADIYRLWLGLVFGMSK